MARRILTTATVDELLAAGTTELRLGPGDIVTALAREYALKKGVRLIPGDAPAPAAGTAEEPTTAVRIHTAVVKALGYEPDDLDAIIARALR
ncbi:MAG: hypothetical protein IPJ61_08280 [Tessaracoccus sp.]|uniref:hypothetical protein n=1 Tax=Tessaracoccus sp. TaxID=1971211 RepID=UPI001ECE73F1|nr:hypothetical protein [Tessaracoccus sp.]MBK7821060.1 hypothetical protein [Tessaracoccus sp.]